MKLTKIKSFVNMFLKKNKFKYKGSLQVFSNHLLELIKRIDNNKQYAEDVTEDMILQISDKTKSISKIFTNCFLLEFKITSKISDFEFFLISTHVLLFGNERSQSG